MYFLMELLKGKGLSENLKCLLKSRIFLKFCVAALKYVLSVVAVLS